MVLIGPKRHTDATGDISEAAIITRLLRAGYIVLTPYGKNHRYDLLIEDGNGQFWRIQCKTGWVAQDESSVRFNTASNYYHYINKEEVGVNRRRNYRGQVEYFAVYCETLDKVYLVPVETVGVTQAMLRLTPTKNNQEKNVRWAQDYEL